MNDDASQGMACGTKDHSGGELLKRILTPEEHAITLHGRSGMGCCRRESSGRRRWRDGGPHPRHTDKVTARSHSRPRSVVWRRIPVVAIVQIFSHR